MKLQTTVVTQAVAAVFADWQPMGSRPAHLRQEAQEAGVPPAVWGLLSMVSVALQLVVLAAKPRNLKDMMTLGWHRCLHHHRDFVVSAFLRQKDHPVAGVLPLRNLLHRLHQAFLRYCFLIGLLTGLAVPNRPAASACRELGGLPQLQAHWVYCH